MYSNKKLRFLIIVFLLLGLIPLALMALKSGQSEYNSFIFSSYIRAMFASSIFAVTATLILLKISSVTLEPFALTSLGIMSLYVFCSTIAGFVPVIGILVLVILGWGLSCWFLELPLFTGVFVGIVFFSAKFIGILFALTGSFNVQS